MYLANNVSRRLLMYINQEVFTSSFPLQKSVLDAEQDNGATTVGVKDKTT